MKLKPIGKIIIMAGVLVLALTTKTMAQIPPFPPPDTNNIPNTNVIDWAAIAAAQQADYSNNYAPWVIPDIESTSTQIPASIDNQSQQVNQSLVLSSNLTVMQNEQHAAVSNLLLQIGLPQTWTNLQGDTFFFDHTNPDGSASVKMTCNLESAETVGAQKLWPGGGSGYNLNGSNITLAEWDGGDVLTNHQEFTNGFRVSLLNGPSGDGISDHATHVAGTIAAYGVSSSAIGFANRANLVESVDEHDLSQMATITANRLLKNAFILVKPLNWGVV